MDFLSQDYPGRKCPKRLWQNAFRPFLPPRSCVRILPGIKLRRHLNQRPLKSAFRFSMNAAMPSFMSSVEARRPKREDSKSRASGVAVSSAR